MEKKQKILSIVLAASLLAFTAGCGSSVNGSTNENQSGNGGYTQVLDVTYETYGSFWMRCHDYKTMPIGAYNALTAPLYDKPDLYAAYKEAGVNMMIGLSEPVSIKALDFCADYGLAYLLTLNRQDTIEDEAIAKTALAQAKYHEAFAGIIQADEPGRASFETIARMQTALDGFMPELTKGALWWVNLFPLYATDLQLYYRIPEEGKGLPEGMSGYTYEEYVSDYMRICKPKVLSYDYYALPSTTQAERGTLRKDYFRNMTIIRSAAMQANIPFWGFVQTCQYTPTTFIPNEAELLWSVNTLLSCGAKGIQYFTGVVPGVNTDLAYFNGAMFDTNGNRTEVYNYVKTANTQIKAVDEVLMCSKSKGMMVVGSSPWGNDCNSYIPESDTLLNYGELSSATAEHALIGCFDYNGKSAFYITNNSILESDEVSLFFDSSIGGYAVAKGEKTPFTGAELKAILGAGEGVLVVIE